MYQALMIQRDDIGKTAGACSCFCLVALTCGGISFHRPSTIAVQLRVLTTDVFDVSTMGSKETIGRDFRWDGGINHSAAKPFDLSGARLG